MFARCTKQEDNHTGSFSKKYNEKKMAGYWAKFFVFVISNPFSFCKVRDIHVQFVWNIKILLLLALVLLLVL